MSTNTGYKNMIIGAVDALSEMRGSSEEEIVDYILTHFVVKEKYTQSHTGYHIGRLIEDDKLYQSRKTPVSRYRITKGYRKEMIKDMNRHLNEYHKYKIENY